MKRIKLAVLLSLFGLVGIAINSSHQFSSNAENDKILAEIAEYKSWKKISKEGIKVDSSPKMILSGG